MRNPISLGGAVVAASIWLAATPAAGQKAADHLRVVSGNAVTNVDPYYRWPCLP